MTTSNREIQIFHRDALLRPLEDDGESDAFYDFTEEDYHRLLQARNSGEAVLKTKVIREREEREAAEKLDPIRIRYVFPDRLICQAQFSSLETIGHLLQFLKNIVLTEYENRVHLFTVPPKTVLSDEALSLFHAKLVPSANVYVEFQDGERWDSQEVLKPFILEMQRRSTASVPMSTTEPKQNPVSISATLTPEKRPAKDPDARQKQVPKWFKMGKK